MIFFVKLSDSTNGRDGWYFASREDLESVVETVAMDVSEGTDIAEEVLECETGLL